MYLLKRLLVTDRRESLRKLYKKHRRNCNVSLFFRNALLDIPEKSLGIPLLFRNPKGSLLRDAIFRNPSLRIP